MKISIIPNYYSRETLQCLIWYHGIIPVFYFYKVNFSALNISIKVFKWWFDQILCISKNMTIILIFAYKLISIFTLLYKQALPFSIRILSIINTFTGNNYLLFAPNFFSVYFLLYFLMIWWCLESGLILQFKNHRHQIHSEQEIWEDEKYFPLKKYIASR